MGEHAVAAVPHELPNVPANDQGSPVAPPLEPQSLRLSQLLYGISWEEHLPLTLTDDGVTASMVSWREALPFFEQNQAEAFGNHSPFFRSANLTGRERYFNYAADVFIFRHDGRPVGVHICNPTDWSTYYIRLSMLLPSYRGREVIHRFLKWQFELLAQAGVERAEADTAPSNQACISMMMKTGFYAEGTQLSERWGAQIRFVRHLDPKAKAVFLRQFCHSGDLHDERRCG